MRNNLQGSIYMLTPIQEISQDYFFNMLEQAYEQYQCSTNEERLSKKYWYNRCYVMLYHLFTDDNSDKERLSEFVESRKPLDQIYFGLCSSRNKEPGFPKLKKMSPNTDYKLQQLLSELEENLAQIKNLLQRGI